MAIAAVRWPRTPARSRSAGRSSEEASPSAAQSLGIGVVYQHTSVLADLTVAENLLYCVPVGAAVRRDERQCLDRRAARRGRGSVRQAQARQRAQRCRAQLVEIAKALAQRPQVRSSTSRPKR
jgi:ABC-type sugar transport system ATPase subunit